MYEHYVGASETGIKNVSVNVDEENMDVSVTVTFATGTDTEAWVTIHSDGSVHPSFGGTGICGPDLEKYIQHSVDIWKAITGKDEAATLLKSYN